MISSDFSRVYYFTSAKYAIQNITRKRLKVSRIADLNDPFELMGVDLRDEVHRKAVANSKAYVDKNCGIVCFSAAWGNPVLWGHYADKHFGIALGFDVRKDKLQKIFYETEPIKLTYDTSDANVRIERSVLERMIATKFIDWKYEQEFRIFVTLDSSTSECGLNFLPFSSELVLREVVLGPRCQTQPSEVQALVSKWTPDVSIFNTRIAFDSFRIVAGE